MAEFFQRLQTQAFSHLDQDGDGTINAKEMQDSWKSFGMHLTDAQVTVEQSNERGKRDLKQCCQIWPFIAILATF